MLENRFGRDAQAVDELCVFLIALHVGRTFLDHFNDVVVNGKLMEHDENVVAFEPSDHFSHAVCLQL